jgi:protein disulfide-isomerase
MKRVLSVLFACCVVGTLFAADSTWLTSVPEARAKAEKEKKLVLLDFTGSDWCPWCIKLHTEVFSKPEFADYAKKNLVLVKVDFPRNKPQSDELKAANKALFEKYEIPAYPTLVVLKPDGTVVWKQVGYPNDGKESPLSTVIAKLDEAKTK